MTAVAHASPLTDLASPSQATRDAAAAALRATYAPLSGAAWIRKFGGIKPGATKKSVVDRLTPEQAHALGVFAQDGASVEEYRLDDGWVLLCMFKASVETVLRCRVREVVRHVLVEPPSGYTGPWTDYFVSGQRASESSYKDGVQVGTTTVFHPNGNKALVRTYGPNGRVQSNVWYNEAGAVTRSDGKP
jgi:hypothetical protein